MPFSYKNHNEDNWNFKNEMSLMSIHLHMGESTIFGDMPAGNLAFCNSIICSGSMPSKPIHLLELMNCQATSQATYFKFQKIFMHPAIDST